MSECHSIQYNITLHAHALLQYRGLTTTIQQTHTLLTYQKASTKNLPALFSTSSSTCCVLLINFTFRGLSNIAPSPNIGPVEENASIVVAVVSMTIHIIIKKQCVIVLWCMYYWGVLFFVSILQLRQIGIIITFIAVGNIFFF